MWHPIKHVFGFAVPTDAALSVLEACSPLLEVGAGTGYWAHCLSMRGADAVATDAQPPDSSILNNPYFSSQHAGRGSNIAARVVKADAADAAALCSNRCLLIVYPYSEGAVIGTDWAPRALAAYTGTLVAHVGRLPAPGGGASHTTSAQFAELLRAGFTPIHSAEQRLPSRPGEEDALMPWERKKEMN